MSVIRTQDLTKTYSGKVVLNHLNLEIPAGTIYGFLGRNGAGKSTTTRILMGLANPDSGSAQIFGEDCCSLSDEARNRIGYIAEGHPLYPWMSIREHLNWVRSLRPKWNSQLVEQVLDYFKLPQKKKIRSLSKGQKAQVSLTAVIATDPDLLILDDPTLGLDPVVRRDLMESLIELIQRQDRTVFFSSHILSEVERVADRIGILVDGQLKVDAPTDQILESFKQFTLTFDGEPPELRKRPGMVSTQRAGHTLKVVTRRIDDAILQDLEDLKPMRTDVSGMNLEDVFFAYTTGDRSSRPIFHVETNFDSEQSRSGS